jgi:hypothetical protein
MAGKSNYLIKMYSRDNTTRFANRANGNANANGDRNLVSAHRSIMEA